jgi:hypothetical protein
MVQDGGAAGAGEAPAFGESPGGRSSSPYEAAESGSPALARTTPVVAAEGSPIVAPGGVDGGAAVAATAESTPWWDLLQRLRLKKPAMAASLSAAEVLGEEGGYLMIRLPAENARFAAATLESTENRPVLLAALREVFGKPIGLRIQPGVVESPPAPPPSGGRASPPAPPQARSNLSDIQRIAEQMDGEIIGPS